MEERYAGPGGAERSVQLTDRHVAPVSVGRSQHIPDNGLLVS